MTHIQQGGAVAARVAHTHEVAGSNPAPAIQRGCGSLGRRHTAGPRPDGSCLSLVLYATPNPIPESIWVITRRSMVQVQLTQPNGDRTATNGTRQENWRARL